MHTTRLLLALGAAALMTLPATAAPRETRSPEARRLHALFAEAWEDGARRFPEWATYRGDHRFDRVRVRFQIIVGGGQHRGVGVVARVGDQKRLRRKFRLRGGQRLGGGEALHRIVRIGPIHGQIAERRIDVVRRGVDEKVADDEIVIAVVSPMYVSRATGRRRSANTDLVRFGAVVHAIAYEIVGSGKAVGRNVSEKHARGTMAIRSDEHFTVRRQLQQLP